MRKIADSRQGRLELASKKQAAENSAKQGRFFLYGNVKDF